MSIPKVTKDSEKAILPSSMSSSTKKSERTASKTNSKAISLSSGNSRSLAPRSFERRNAVSLGPHTMPPPNTRELEKKEKIAEPTRGVLNLNTTGSKTLGAPLTSNPNSSKPAAKQDKPSPKNPPNAASEKPWYLYGIGLIISAIFIATVGPYLTYMTAAVLGVMGVVCIYKSGKISLPKFQ